MSVPTSDPMSADASVAAANVSAARRLIEEGFGRGDLRVCDELVSPDAVEHQLGLKPGPEGTKEAISTLHRWFSDFRLEIDDLVVSGDTVWTRNRGSGVNTGSVMGRPATGKRFEIYVFDVLRFADGKLVEHWGVPDQLGMLTQLGLFGRAETAEARTPVGV